MTSVKLITINVEFDKHWDTLIPFLEKERPEVLCVQELLDHDVEMLKERFGYEGLYQPIVKIYDKDGNETPLGDAIFTTLPITDSHAEYYFEYSEDLSVQDYNLAIDTEELEIEQRKCKKQGVVLITVQKGDELFSFATTHFTWARGCLSSPYQVTDMESLLNILGSTSELILAGDFNIPRHFNDQYEVLIKRLTDNIPQSVKSSLDLKMHKAVKKPGGLENISKYVVDYIFSTPTYAVSNVRQVCGISDHCAFIADISKV